MMMLSLDLVQEMMTFLYNNVVVVVVVVDIVVRSTQQVSQFDYNSSY